MKNAVHGLLLVAGMLVSNFAISAEAYVNANVVRVESFTVNGGLVNLYLENATGTVPLAGNGCSNDAIFPMIIVARGSVLTDI